MKTIHLLVTVLFLFFITPIFSQYKNLNFKIAYNAGWLGTTHHSDPNVDRKFMMNLGLGRRFNKNFAIESSLDVINYSDIEPRLTRYSSLLNGNFSEEQLIIEDYFQGTLIGLTVGPTWHLPIAQYDFSFNFRSGATWIKLNQFLESNYSNNFGSSAWVEDEYYYDRKIFPTFSLSSEVSIWTTGNLAFIFGLGYTHIVSGKKMGNAMRISEGDFGIIPVNMTGSIITARRDIKDLNGDYMLFNINLGLKYAIFK